MDVNAASEFLQLPQSMSTSRRHPSPGLRSLLSPRACSHLHDGTSAGGSSAGAGCSCRARHSANCAAQGDMSKITCAASVAVLSLFAEGTLVQLWLKWPFLPHLKQIGAGRLFSPNFPSPPGGAEPEVIPGGFHFFVILVGGFLLAVGCLPSLPFQYLSPFLLVLPYRG